MKRMHTSYVKKILCCIMLTNYFPFTASADTKTESKTEDIVSIERVSGESGKKLSIVNIFLSAKPKIEKIEVESHGTFLQLSLKNTLVPKPGKFYDISSPYLKKMVLIQNENNEAIIRIFTSKDSSLIAKASDVDILNKRIVLTADHKYLKKLIANSAPETKVETETKAEEKSSEIKEESIASAPVVGPQLPQQAKVSQNQGMIPDSPFTLDTESMPSNLIVGTQGDSFNSKLRLVAIFSVGMILLMLFSLTWRRMAINKRLLSPRKDNIPMQALNHLILAPKQKLSLVQVGHEKLLLSVSPEGISLITHIPEKKRLEPSSNRAKFNDADKEKMQTIMMRNINRQPSISEDGRSKLNATSDRQRIPKMKKEQQPLNTTKQESSEDHLQSTRKPHQHNDPSMQSHKKIEYAVDDNGIRKTDGKRSAKTQPNTTQKAIDDVTHLIREKLKSLPKI